MIAILKTNCILIIPRLGYLDGPLYHSIVTDQKFIILTKFEKKNYENVEKLEKS